MDYVCGERLILALSHLHGMGLGPLPGDPGLFGRGGAGDRGEAVAEVVTGPDALARREPGRLVLVPGLDGSIGEHLRSVAETGEVLGYDVEWVERSEDDLLESIL